MINQAYKKVGFWFGLILFFWVLLSDPPQSISHQAWLVASVTLLMAVWWGTESIPLPVTALLPLALFPLMNIMSFKDAASSYASPSVYLFLGGFILALAIQSSGLHKRMALSVITSFNNSASGIVGILMAISFTLYVEKAEKAKKAKKAKKASASSKKAMPKKDGRAAVLPAGEVN